MRVTGIDKEFSNNNDKPLWCNKECYAIYLEDRDPLIVSEELFFKYYLYERDEISEDEYEEIGNLFKLECAKQTASGFIFYRKCTTAEVRKKLLDSGHEREAVESAIEYYIKQEYLNDTEYTEAYVRTVIKNKIMSFNEMCMKLGQKGISRDMVKAAAEKYDFDEHSMLMKAVEKKTHGAIPKDYKGKIKLMRFLSGKGYSSESVSSLEYFKNI